MSGANIPTPFVTDNLIPSAAILNKAWIRTVQEIQDMLRHGLLPDSIPADGTGFAFGGFDCARFGGLDKTEVQPGAGFVFDSSISARSHPSVDSGALMSDWGAVHSHVAIQADHSAPHATLDRIDVVTIKSVPGTDENESVLQFGSAIPVNVDTQTGPTVVVTVTEGTPDASPVAPLPPAGEILLCEVLIENAGGGGSYTYSDKRSWLGIVNRDADEPFRIVTDAITGTKAYMFFNDRTRNLAHAWQLDMVTSMPTFFRQSPDGSILEHGGQMYPRMSIFGRKWTRTTSWERAGSVGLTTDGNFAIEREGFFIGGAPEYRGLRVEKTGTSGAGAKFISISPDMDGLCGLRLDEVVIEWNLASVLDAVDGEILEAAVFFWDASAQTATDIGAVPLQLLSNVLGDHSDIIALIASTPLIDQGDMIYVVVKHTYFTAGPAGPETFWRTVRCRFIEGQT